MIEACTKRGAGFFPVTTTYSDHDVTVLSTFKFTAMVKFRCATIIILGQVLQASTRSTPASDLFRRYMMSSSSLPMSNPDLISWTQSRLGALYETREGEAFANAFDAVFSPSCEVRVNHTPSTLDVFKSSVLSRMAASAGVALSWENMITTGNRTDEVSSPIPILMYNVIHLLIALSGFRNSDHYSQLEVPYPRCPRPMSDSHQLQCKV